MTTKSRDVAVDASRKARPVQNDDASGPDRKRHLELDATVEKGSE